MMMANLVVLILCLKKNPMFCTFAFLCLFSYYVHFAVFLSINQQWTFGMEKLFLADQGIRTFLSTMFLFCFPSVRYRMVSTLKCMQYVPVIQKQSYSSFGRQSFYGLWLPICMELLLLKRKPKRKRKQCDHLKGSHRDFTSSKSIQMAFVKTHLSCPLQVLIWQAKMLFTATFFEFLKCLENCGFRVFK